MRYNIFDLKRETLFSDDMTIEKFLDLYCNTISFEKLLEKYNNRIEYAKKVVLHELKRNKNKETFKWNDYLFERISLN